MIILTRIIIFLGIILFAYYWLRYLLNPKRKLELAHEKGNTFFLDDEKNVRKNFLITHRKVFFEGEKYLGTTDQAFVVTQVFIWAHHPTKLQGFEKRDFYDIEAIIKEKYPQAEIHWKSPIKEFLRGEKKW